MIHKLLSLWLVMAFGSMSFAQDAQRVDAIITLYPKQLSSAEQLSEFISRDFTHPEDKLRAIYGWIINNIAYDPDEYKALDYSFTTVKERNEKQSNFRFELIERVLDKGVAVCEGYAMLFERLCELQDIQSYLVRGDTKASLADINRDYNTSHMWNIAFINEQAVLLDPTWGAGKYNGQKFIKEPTYRYFMTAPEQLIRTHYPLDYADSLLNWELSQADFLKAPIVIDPGILNGQEVLPALGTLSSKVASGNWEFFVPYATPVKVSYSFGEDVESLGTISPENNLLEFSVPAALGASFLIVYFNDSPSLAYRIE